MGPRMREDNGGEGAHKGRPYGGRGVGEADFYDDESSQGRAVPEPPLRE